MNSNEMEDEEDESSTFSTATKVICVAGAIGAVAGLISWMSSGSGEKETAEKMMKAPGKDGYTVRKDFENNPKKYFENLHKFIVKRTQVVQYADFYQDDRRKEHKPRGYKRYSSDTIDLKIHGPIRELFLRLGPDLGPEAVMRIYVSTLAGKVFILELERTKTIKNVMAKINKKGGPPVDLQKLIFQGKQLDKGLTMAYYGIKTESIPLS